MKKRLTHLFFPAIILLGSSLSAQVILQQWTFSEDNGTELSAASNSGSGDFAFDTALDARSQIIGGVLDIRGLNNEIASYPAFAGGSAVTNSLLQLSFDVPAFDLSGGDGGGANVSVDFLDGSTVLGTLRLRKNGNDFKATLNNDIGIEVTLKTNPATDTSGMSVVMAIDLANNTYSASLTGGGITDASLGVVSFDSGATASQITQIRVRASALATTDWGASDYFQIDNLTLTAVPEPSTYALLAGFGALGLVLYRRRRG